MLSRGQHTWMPERCQNMCKVSTLLYIKTQVRNTTTPVLELIIIIGTICALPWG